MIISSKEIFTEKQLREFTATYSVDERFNFITWFTGLLGKKDDQSTTTTDFAQPATAGKKSASDEKKAVAILEEKTALYLKGKIDAKVYYKELVTVFGANLPSALPQILSNLPANSAKELKKVIDKK